MENSVIGHSTLTLLLMVSDYVVVVEGDDCGDDDDGDDIDEYNGGEVYTAGDDDVECQCQ